MIGLYGSQCNVFYVLSTCNEIGKNYHGLLFTNIKDGCYLFHENTTPGNVQLGKYKLKGCDAPYSVQLAFYNEYEDEGEEHDTTPYYFTKFSDATVLQSVKNIKLNEYYLSFQKSVRAGHLILLEELVKVVCHPKNFDKFAELGFYDEE